MVSRSLCGQFPRCWRGRPRSVSRCPRCGFNLQCRKEKGRPKLERPIAEESPSCIPKGFRRVDGVDDRFGSIIMQLPFHDRPNLERDRASPLNRTRIAAHPFRRRAWHPVFPVAVEAVIDAVFDRIRTASRRRLFLPYGAWAPRLAAWANRTRTRLPCRRPARGLS